MARYVMASRRAGRFRASDKEAAREAFDMTMDAMAADVDVVADNDPADPRARRVAVIDSGPGEVAALAATLPREVILEPEILHWTGTDRPAEFADADRATLLGPVGTGQTVRVQVTGGGGPLPLAAVTLFLRGLGGLRRQVEAVTNTRGRASLAFGPFWEPAALVVVPAAGFWSMLSRQVEPENRIDCPALPGDGPLAWWHEALGVDRWSANAGRGIRVGVIDTGLGPHPALAHARAVGAFLDGGFDPAGGADADSHGTHVSGIIGARSGAEGVPPGSFGGLAPGARLVVARVFPPGGGANQADIANALDHLSKVEEVDLVNLSLGSPQPSQIEHDAILDALERGTLCVCAAANSAGPVEFPAAFPETVAVSALGRLGWGPPGSLAATRLPQEASRFGARSLYLANFSCYGPEITCAGPGVGIIAPVPARPALVDHGVAAPYGVMDGTSMASPAVVGLLARLLSRDRAYRELARDQSRAEQARAVLLAACTGIDLAPAFAGKGLPRQR